jgi:hypothetical protein
MRAPLYLAEPDPRLGDATLLSRGRIMDLLREPCKPINGPSPTEVAFT